MISFRSDLMALFRLATPMIIARLSAMSLVFVDTVVVGRYSPDELAFMSLASVPISVLIVAVYGFLTGLQVLAARAMGAGDLEAAGAAWRRGLFDSLVLGSAAALALIVFAKPLMHALGQPPALVAGATPVIIVLALGMPFQIMFAATSSLLESMRRPGAGMIIMLGAIGLNYALDVALVTGAWGFPAMGAVGAALATLAVRALMLTVLLIWVFNLPEAKGLALLKPRPPNRDLAHEQRQIGMAAGASQTFEVAAFAGMTVFAGWVSTMAVASYAIAINLTGLVFMVAMGLATASGIIVSQAIGAKEGARAIRAGWMGVAVTTVSMSAFALIAFAFPGLFANIYARDAALLAATIPLIALAAFVFVADGAQVVLATILRARGDVWFPTASHLFAYIAIMLPLGWLLAVYQGHGSTGLMGAIIVASAISGGVLLFRWTLLAGRPVLGASSSPV